MKDDIEAVECFCGRQAQEATEFKPLEEKNSFKAFLGWTGAATATKQCNMWIHAFNRLPKSERPCAIIFEDTMTPVNGYGFGFKLNNETVLKISFKREDVTV